MRLLALLTLTGCWLQPKPCEIHLRYDGGATKRPYYAVEICNGAPPRVLCDSPTPLPTPTCPTATTR